MSGYCLFLTALVSLQGLSNSATLRYGDKEMFTINDTGDVYEFHKTSDIWKDARDRCRADGAQLLVPDNVAEAAAVVEVVKNLTDMAIWIGVSDLAKHGTFETVDGWPISAVHSKWYAGESDTGFDFHCIMMASDTSLSTADCSRARFYVCKFPARTDSSSSSGESHHVKKRSIDNQWGNALRIAIFAEAGNIPFEKKPGSYYNHEEAPSDRVPWTPLSGRNSWPYNNYETTSSGRNSWPYYAYSTTPSGRNSWSYHNYATTPSGRNSWPYYDYTITPSERNSWSHYNYATTPSGRNSWSHYNYGTTLY